MLNTCPEHAPYERFTFRPLATYDHAGVRATLSLRSDGWVSWVAGQHPHWCDAGACRTRPEAVEAVEQAVRERGIAPSGRDHAADRQEPAHV